VGVFCINSGFEPTLKAQLPCVVATAPPSNATERCTTVSLEGNTQFSTENYGKGGLLDTTICITRTNFPNLYKSIRFTSVDSIDRNAKKANIEALNFYIFKKVDQIKRGLLLKTLNEYYIGYAPFKSLPTTNIPFDVIENYNRGIVEYKNRALLNYAEKSFGMYVRSIKKNHGYLDISNPSTVEQSLMPLLGRYDKVYRDKIVKRMNWLVHHYGNENVCLLTLTLDPKKYGNDKFKMWEDISKHHENFIRKLRRYFKEHGREFPAYLFSIEAMFGRPENNYMSRGNPHLHSAFFAKYLAPAKVLRKFWGQGHVKINSTANNVKVKYPIHYITKYITKAFTVNEPNNMLVQSLVWLFNKHSFDHTQGLMAPLYPKGSGEWKAHGIWSIEATPLPLNELLAITDVEQSLLAVLQLGAG